MFKRDPSPSRTLVKSAVRTMDILEYLSLKEDHEATLSDVARHLNLPPSSSVGLLRTLEQMGYLSRKRGGKAYRLTARVVALGARVGPHIFGNGALLRALEEIHCATGKLVTLAIRDNHYIRVVDFIQEPSESTIKILVGGRYPMTQTSAGFMFLSTLPDQEIQLIIRRINAETLPQDTKLSIHDLMQQIAMIRHRGYAYLADAAKRGIAGVSFLIPTKHQDDSLALVIVGCKSDIEENMEQYVNISKGILDKHCEN